MRGYTMIIKSKFSALKWPMQNNTTMKVKTDNTIMHNSVLLVAGVRASGKSTFINALKSNNLDSSIRSSLPAGVEKWPQVNAKDMVLRNKQGQVQVKIKLYDSFILHYDILRPLTYNMNSFQEDQLLNYLINMKALNVISIFPNSKQLIEQFSERLELRKQNLSTVARLNLYAQSYIYKNLRAANISSPPQKLKPLLLYQDHVWLRDYHKSWKTFIENNIDSSRHIKITPMIGIRPGWALIDYN
jgi:hypothetical protein